MYPAGQAINALPSKFTVHILRWALGLDHGIRENVSIAVQPEELSTWYSKFPITTERTDEVVAAAFYTRVQHLC